MNSEHSKKKGNVGFTSVILALQKAGFNVFTEVGDYSRIDLIAEKNNVIKKVQVKYCGNKDFLILKLEKSGPNGYRYTYSEKDVDWFCIYSPISEQIAWIKADYACLHKCQLNIRFVKPKNNQTNGLHFIEDFGIDKFEIDF